MKKLSKKLLSLLLAASLLIGLLPAGAMAAPKTNTLPFTDVKTSDWFYEPVQYAYENGLMAGTGDRIFDPNVTTTRGMIVTILHRMEGSPSVSSSSFSDVSSNQWYATAVNWAAQNGVVSGYGNGKFGPNDPITREQMASIMMRYSEFKGYDVSASDNLSKFNDRNQISDYAVDVMKWAVGSGLLSGRGNNLLAPQGQTTRAEAATILMRYCEDIVSESGDTVTVTFDSNGGSNVLAQTVNKGSKVKEPNAPTREGYSFVGWKMENSTDLFDFASTTVFNDITLVAQWEAEDFDAAHEEFMDKNIYDFDADRVLQADESDTEDNFAVVKDDVELVKDNKTNNQVVSADKDTGVYVISNITDEVKSLKNGDKFMMVSDSDVDNNISLIVSAISISGNTATITSSGGNIEDFYEYIQINDEYAVSEEYMQDDTITTSGDSSGNGLQISEGKPIDHIFVGSSTQLGGTAEKTYTHKVIYPEGAKEEESLLHGQTDLALSITVVLEYDEALLGIEYLRCDVIGNFDLRNDYTVNFINASKEFSATLFPVNMPIGTTGVSIVGDISFVFNPSGSVIGKFDSAYSRNVGFRFTTDDGFSPINEILEDDASVEIKAKVSMKAGIAPSLGLMLVSVLDGRLTGEVGAEASVTGEKDLLHPDPTHLCALCFDGDLGLYAQLGVLLQAHLAGEDFTIFKDDDLIKATYPLGTFYCSFLNENGECEFGWGECPYKNVDPGQVEDLIVISGKVVSANSGNAVSGVHVRYTSPVTHESFTAQTAANGNFALNVTSSIDEGASLEFSKDGWISFESPVSVSGSQKEINIGTLEMTPTSSGELITPETPIESEDNEGTTIIGTIVDNSWKLDNVLGVEDADIYVYYNEKSSQHYEYNELIAHGKATDDGQFSIYVPTRGCSVRLEVVKDGYAVNKEEVHYLEDSEYTRLSSIGIYTSEEGASIGERCKLQLKGTIYNNAVNATEEVVEGATITFHLEGSDEIFSTVSDSEGHFALNVNPVNNGNPGIVTFSKDGYWVMHPTSTIENYYLAHTYSLNYTPTYNYGAIFFAK